MMKLLRLIFLVIAIYLAAIAILGLIKSEAKRS